MQLLRFIARDTSDIFLPVATEVIAVTAVVGSVRASSPCLRDGPHHRLETKMKFPDDTGFENRELSIEELDAIAGGGVWGWIKHEVGSAAK
jgi:hypothetical protein